MVTIKKGFAKIANPSGVGFSFDTWVYERMLDGGFTISRSCCHDKHLMLNSGTYIFKNSKTKNKNLFNLDKWLIKNLIDLNLAPPEEMCCSTKSRLFLIKEYAFFNKESLGNIDLRKRLKELLNLWSIPYIDSCCY